MMSATMATAAAYLVPATMLAVDAAGEPIRIDRWLWAARFFKSRGLAAEAVTGGRVHVGGRRVKPSREVRPGDELEVSIGDARISLVVRGTAPRRGPARDAALLYEETAASAERRARQAAERRLAGPSSPAGPRPTKRDRRRLDAGRPPR
jgi:ribosome-associated heat shock protein Hsp15